MATVTERLLLFIEADARGAIAGLDATGAAAESNLGPIEGRGAAASGATIALGAAAVFAGAEIVRGLSSADKAYDSLAGQTRQIQRLTGDTAEDASGLIAAGQQSGVAFDSLTTGLTRLSKNSGHLKDIGVDLNDSAGKARPLVAVLGDVADWFEKAPAGIDKTAEAVTLFGRGGTAMLPLLNQGKQGIADLVAHAKDMGVVLGQDDVNQMAKHVQAQRELDESLDGLRVSFGRAVDPEFTAGLTAVKDVVQDVAGFIHDHPLGAEVLAIGGGATALAAILGGAYLVGTGIKSVIGTYSTLGAVLDSLKASYADDTEGATELELANERATATAEALAAAQERVAEAAAAPVLLEESVGTAATTSSAAAAPTVAADTANAAVQESSQAAVAAEAEVGAQAAATGEQMVLAFSDGAGQLDLFTGQLAGTKAELASVGTAATTGVEDAAAAMSAIAGSEAAALEALFAQVTTSARTMSVELEAAYAGTSGLSVTAEVPSAVALAEADAAAAQLGPDLQAAFLSGVAGASEFDDALLSSIAEMRVFGAEAVGVWEEIDAAAAKAALTETEAASAPEAGGLLAGLGGSALGIGAAVIAVPIVAQLTLSAINGLTDVESKIKESLTHLEATTTEGGKSMMDAFGKAAHDESTKISWGSIFDLPNLALNQFALGGHGSNDARNYNLAFQELLSGGGTQEAQAFVDQVKQQDQALNHNSDDYKQSEALVRQWQKAIDDATGAEKAQTSATDGDTASLDRFGLAIDSKKTSLGQFASSLSSVSQTAFGVVNAFSSVQQANQSVQNDFEQLLKDQAGGLGLDPSQQAAAVADASDKAAASARSEQEADRSLAAAQRDLATARAAAAADPSDATKAQAVTTAETNVANATDQSKNAADAAASSERDLLDIRANRISQANQLADAEDRINQSIRSQAAALRTLQESQTTLADDEAKLAHINPLTNPNLYRDTSARVQQERDQVANNADSVANAGDQVAAAQRNRLQIAAQQQADQADKVANDRAQLARDQNAAAEAAIGLVVAEAQLADLVSQDPNALPALLDQIQKLADEGIIPQSTADAFKLQLQYAAAAAGGLAAALNGASGAVGAPTKPGTEPPYQPASVVPSPVAGGRAEIPTPPAQSTYQPASVVPSPVAGGRAEIPAGTSTSTASVLPTNASVVAFLNGIDAQATTGTMEIVQTTAGSTEFIKGTAGWAVYEAPSNGFGGGGVTGFADGGQLGGLPNSSSIENHTAQGGLIMAYEAGPEAHFFVPLGGDKTAQAMPTYLAAGDALGAWDPTTKLGKEVATRIQPFADGGSIGSWTRAAPISLASSTSSSYSNESVVDKLDELLDAIENLPGGLVINNHGVEHPTATAAETIRGVRAGKHLAGQTAG